MAGLENLGIGLYRSIAAGYRELNSGNSSETRFAPDQGHISVIFVC